MSLLTLASVAVARDLAGAGEPLAKDRAAPKMPAVAGGAGQGQPASEAQTPEHPTTGGETPAGSIAGFAQLLVAQIPSEALLAYTTLLALFSTVGVSYNVGRWGVYAAAIVVCALTVLVGYLAQRDYRFDDAQTSPAPDITSAPASVDTPAPAQVTESGKLHLPYLPVLAAVLSMAVYGLTVPGSPLQFEVSGTAFAICSGCLAVGGGVMMSIFAPFLGKGNGAKAVPKQRLNALRPSRSVDSRSVAGGTSTPQAPAQSLRQIPSLQTPPGVHVRE